MIEISDFQPGDTTEYFHGKDEMEIRCGGAKINGLEGNSEQTVGRKFIGVRIWRKGSVVKVVELTGCKFRSGERCTMPSQEGICFRVVSSLEDYVLVKGEIERRLRRKK